MKIFNLPTVVCSLAFVFGSGLDAGVARAQQEGAAPQLH